MHREARHNHLQMNRPRLTGLGNSFFVCLLIPFANFRDAKSIIKPTFQRRKPRLSSLQNSRWQRRPLQAAGTLTSPLASRRKRPNATSVLRRLPSASPKARVRSGRAHRLPPAALVLSRDSWEVAVVLAAFASFVVSYARMSAASGGTGTWWSPRAAEGAGIGTGILGDRAHH
jgi:hypothetical protein